MRGGQRRRRRSRRRKFPICVKAKVTDPFQAAAQKDEIVVINDKLDNFFLFHGILLPLLRLLLLLPCLIYLFGQTSNWASQTLNQASQTSYQAS